jgi:hypothetical protein
MHVKSAFGESPGMPTSRTADRGYGEREGSETDGAAREFRKHWTIQNYSLTAPQFTSLPVRSQDIMSDIYHIMDAVSFDFERNFKALPAVTWAGKNWQLSIAIVIIYLMGIQIGTAYVARMKVPFDLKYPLAVWNAFLCVFSFIGMVKTVRGDYSCSCCC